MRKSFMVLQPDAKAFFWVLFGSVLGFKWLSFELIRNQNNSAPTTCQKSPKKGMRGRASGCGTQWPGMVEFGP